jgi:hypothetical protein
MKLCKQILNIKFLLGFGFAFLIVYFAFPLCDNWVKYSIVVFCLVANICFLGLLIAEAYNWNNGICRNTGKPWIEESNYQNYRAFVSKKDTEQFNIGIEYLTINYNDEKAKNIDKHFNITESLKYF